MFLYVTGDLLLSKAQALVNPVNCEGYMGKGLALQFKQKFPNNFVSYEKMCKEKKLTIGVLHTYFENDKYIINFPSKNKWRAKSKMEYIEKGLDSLVDYLVDSKIKSVALPPLGCGNGGLEWKEVKLVIEKRLFVLSKNIQFIIYESL